MQLSLIQVDAFTAVPFRGNPAAVCVHPNPLATDLMQAIAQEMNLSETAFVYPEPGLDGWRLRWFTPAVEVDLCGHATLASAHVLWTMGHLAPSAIAHFQTRSGHLTATRQDDWITLNFPATPAVPTPAPGALLTALGLTPDQLLYHGKTSFDYFIEVPSEDLVRSLQPDFTLLRSLPVRGIIITSRAEPTADYAVVSRFFAPGAGIDEDPVTGSAHCALAPYWQPQLQQSTFMAYQASARGGYVQVETQGDRVHLRGQAVTVLQGTLTVSG